MANKVVQELMEFVEAHGQSRLTHTECRIIPLVADGLDNQAIASHLGITYNGVYTHVCSIFSKLGINNRTMLARMYWFNEIIELSEFRLLIPALDKAIQEVTGAKNAS